MSIEQDLSDLRNEYTQRKLRIIDVDNSPFNQFHQWMEEAIKVNVKEPNAMVLATADKFGAPSARMVLLKQYNTSGFAFFTNYESKKAVDIKDNPKGFILFYWPEVERQIRIGGIIEKVSAKISDDYFKQRPPGSRIGAWASPQSRPIPNRTYLENLEQDYAKLFKDKEIKRPGYWGGYRLIPETFEFWQGRANRLHDRIEYYLEDRIWKIHRLAP